MTMDYFTLGATPFEEPCLQVGKADLDQMKEETRRYADLLRRRFPIPEYLTASFSVKTFDHDLGAYPEAIVRFDADCHLSGSFAIFVDGNLPGEWTDADVLTFVPDQAILN